MRSAAALVLITVLSGCDPAECWIGCNPIPRAAFPDFASPQAGPLSITPELTVEVVQVEWPYTLGSRAEHPDRPGFKFVAVKIEYVPSDSFTVYEVDPLQWQLEWLVGDNYHGENNYAYVEHDYGDELTSRHTSGTHTCWLVFEAPAYVRDVFLSWRGSIVIDSELEMTDVGAWRVS